MFYINKKKIRERCREETLRKVRLAGRIFVRSFWFIWGVSEGKVCVERACFYYICLFHRECTAIFFCKLVVTIRKE